MIIFPDTDPSEVIEEIETIDTRIRSCQTQLDCLMAERQAHLELLADMPGCPVEYLQEACGLMEWIVSGSHPEFPLSRITRDHMQRHDVLERRCHSLGHCDPVYCRVCEGDITP